MFNKPFKTLDEQIDILKQRNLKILSEEEALNKLGRYGYYEIINGYKDDFLDNKDDEEDHYTDDATFEQIFSLFQFDKNLRAAVFEAVTEIELTLRAAIAYSIGHRFGSKESDYLIRENYRSGKKSTYRKKQEYEIDQILRKLTKIKKDNTQPFKHYRETHGNIPPWILLKGTTFGNLKSFYHLQKHDIKLDIISIMYSIHRSFVTTDLITLFSDSLSLFHIYRNRAAHSGRIYNYRSDKAKIRFNPILHDAIKVDEAAYRHGFGANDLPTLLGTLRLLNNQSAYTKLLVALRKELNHYRKNYPNSIQSLLITLNITPELESQLNLYEY